MVMNQILNKLEISNLKYEIIQPPSSYLEQEFFYKKNSAEKELVRTVFLNVDGEPKLVLVSDNFGLNIEHIQKALNATKVELLSEDSGFFKTTKNFDYTTFIDKNLLESREEIFLRLGSKDGLIKINSNDLTSIIKSETINLSLLPKYRAKINSVSPKSARDIFEIQNTNCFFGISLENSNFIRPKLMASLEWIIKRFKKCTVLIGDSIHRITLETTKNIDEKTALNNALLLGKEFLQREAAIFKKYSSCCEFEFLFCSEVQKSEEYDVFHKHIKWMFKENNLFRDSVRSFGENYHSKRKDSSTKEEWDLQIQRSSDYFLEEFSIFACIQNKFPVMVYPGSFSTLTEITEGKYEEAPDQLKKLIIVSLQLKQR